MDRCERKVDSRDFSGEFRQMLPACAKNTQARQRTAATTAFGPVLRLGGFGDGTDLRLQGLVVLAFDLEFGLEFFDEEVEVSDLHAEFLDVGW